MAKSKKRDNLLREAIADAKQVRETALANAKLALEEAFTPQLTSMLATKLRNEAEDEDEEDLEEGEEPKAADGHGTGEGGESDMAAIEDSTFKESRRFRGRKLHEAEDDEEDLDEAMGDTEPATDAGVQRDAEGLKSSDIGTESPSNEYGTSNPKDPNAKVRQTSDIDNVGLIQGGEKVAEADDPTLDMGDGDNDEDDLDFDVSGEEEAEAAPDLNVGTDVGDEEGGEEGEEGRDIDLESIIRELEADIEGDEDDDVVGEDDVAPEMDADDRQDFAPEDEMPTEGTAGTQQTDAVADGYGSDEGGETETDATVDSTFKESKNVKLRKEAEDDEDEVDLEEILREIEDEEEEEKTESALARTNAELKEYRTAVKFLRSKLNEVNLLNAKLLYTNRLFRDYNMDVRSKMRVVENFDRATTVREAKLVYATIAESFRGKSGVTRKVRQSITEGLASRKMGSTAPKTVVKGRVSEDTPTILREGVDLARRFQKLAGIKK